MVVSGAAVDDEVVATVLEEEAPEVEVAAREVEATEEADLGEEALGEEVQVVVGTDRVGKPPPKGLQAARRRLGL